MKNDCVAVQGEEAKLAKISNDTAELDIFNECFEDSLDTTIKDCDDISKTKSQRKALSDQ